MFTTINKNGNTKNWWGNPPTLLAGGKMIHSFWKSDRLYLLILLPGTSNPCKMPKRNGFNCVPKDMY